MKSLFVMDPLDALHVEGDSTYVIMREHCDRGHPVWYCTPDDLFTRHGRAQGVVRPVEVVGEEPWFHPGDPVEVDLGTFDVVWMRKDPPFDLSYIFTTYQLEMVPERTWVINDPSALHRFNEKLWAMWFDDLHPPTLLSKDAARLKAFVEEQGRAVLKPWDGNGGRGVVITGAGDRNLGALIELVTDEGRTAAIAQAYLPEIAEGDKRILLFDGEPVGWMTRMPTDDDHRGNMHVGATVERCELTERDRAICDRLRPWLKKFGMLFVGIDVIGNYLTEINVTSPTGIREINRLYDTRLEADLVDRVEERVAARQEDG